MIKSVSKINEIDTQSYIYYNNKNLKSSTEIEMVYLKNPEIKILLIVDLNSNSTTNEYLGQLVIEELENKKGVFYKLNGLKATNIVRDKKSDNIFYFELESKEIWINIKSIIYIGSKVVKEVKLSIKINSSCLLGHLRYMLIELVTNFFFSSFENNNNLHFAMKETQMKLTKNINESFTNKIVENDTIDNMKIKEILTFESEVLLSLFLISIEEILYTVIQNEYINKVQSNNLYNESTNIDNTKLTFIFKSNDLKHKSYIKDHLSNISFNHFSHKNNFKIHFNFFNILIEKFYLDHKNKNDYYLYDPLVVLKSKDDDFESTLKGNESSYIYQKKYSDFSLITRQDKKTDKGKSFLLFLSYYLINDNEYDDLKTKIDLKNMNSLNRSNTIIKSSSNNIDNRNLLNLDIEEKENSNTQFLLDNKQKEKKNSFLKTLYKKNTGLNKYQLLLNELIEVVDFEFLRHSLNNCLITKFPCDIFSNNYVDINISDIEIDEMKKFENSFYITHKANTQKLESIKEFNIKYGIFMIINFIVFCICLIIILSIMD